LIPTETGANPYKNWNEKIHAECYRPNAELGNFEHISFNIGPTLFNWMNTFDQDTCRLIIAQDNANIVRYGVGNAIAQAYNHTILPLATRLDKETQIIWGIMDFNHHFGRRPSGMWLPETAVDIETLTVLAENGIEFTILAPWQAESKALDPTEPYRVSLPGGRSIVVFFYHQELSTGVSFNPPLTTNADQFAQQEVKTRFNQAKLQQNEHQLLLIASDGELYGHHQHFRDRFLAHLMNSASQQAGYSISYPAIWLREYPPQRTVSILEGTSWSCHHGVQRWTGKCNCTPGDGRWKAFLRQGFNRLATALDTLYSKQASEMNINPWELRNAYIQVLIGDVCFDELAAKMAGKRLEAAQLNRLLLLLEAQRERQRMFTSCGWYFEDFSRIEPRNNVAYAAQAVCLTRQATGIDLAAQVMADLRCVESSTTGVRGDIVFQGYLRQASCLRRENPAIP
jgi:hypothetical protein